MDRSRTSNESASAPEATFRQAAGPGSRVKNIADARIPRKRVSPSLSTVPKDESPEPDEVAPSTRLNEGGSPATEPAVLDEPQVASAAPDQYSDRPSHPTDPRATSGASDPKSEREAVTASNASPRIGLESQARLPPLRAPTGPSRIRTPLYSQGCACPFDIASGGQMCGSQSDWVRPGGFDPACYGDPWGETAIFACFVVQLGQNLRNAPMSFCPRS